MSGPTEQDRETAEPDGVLQERYRRERELGDALDRIDGLIHSALDFDAIMARVVKEAARAVGAESAAIYLCEDGEWKPRYTYGLSADMKGHRLLEAEDIRRSEHAVREGRTVVINDLRAHPTADNRVVDRYGVHALMDIGLDLGHGLEGDFVLHYHSPGKEFGDPEIAFINRVGAAVTLAIRNARLFKELRQSEYLLRRVLDTIPIGVWIADTSGRIFMSNPAARAIWAGERFITKDNFDEYKGWWAGTDRRIQSHEWALSRAIERGESRFDEEIDIECFDGSHKTILNSAVPLTDDQGRIIGGIAANVDITEPQRLREEVRASRDFLRAVVENITNSVVVLDRQGKVVDINPRAVALSGYERGELLGAHFSKLLDESALKGLQQEFRGVIDGQAILDREITIIRKDGRRRTIVFSAVPMYTKEHITGLVGTAEDVTERRRMEERIRHMAHHDALTGLPNRRLFGDLFAVALSRARRTGKRLGLLYLDLDRFKEINDSRGHEAGDRLLVEVAGRLAASIRRSDTVARLGGDEFNVLVTDLDHPEDAADVARHILKAFQRPFEIGTEPLVITSSIGISIYPTDGESLDVLMRHADLAMYAAKEGGRNACRFYDAAMNARTSERLALEAALGRAIERNELFLLYQPQMDLKSGVIAGAEALVRWRHNGSVIPPDRFLDIAEQAGMLGAIDQWVLRTACTDAREWPGKDATSFRVSINLSPASVGDGDFPSFLSGVLRETGYPAESLELQVSESAIMNHPQLTIQRMEQLGALGVRVAVDQFGVGHQSIASLQQMRATDLRIAGALVQATAAGGDAVLKAIAAMAHAMDMRVVAEWVETEHQLAAAKAARCDAAQGFLWHRPMPVHALAEIMSGRSVR